MLRVLGVYFGCHRDERTVVVVFVVVVDYLGHDSSFQASMLAVTSRGFEGEYRHHKTESILISPLNSVVPHIFIDSAIGAFVLVFRVSESPWMRARPFKIFAPKHVSTCCVAGCTHEYSSQPSPQI